jgi:hypothetical protein
VDRIVAANSNWRKAVVEVCIWIWLAHAGDEGE